MARQVIQSRQNPLVKSLSRLKTRHGREERERFLIEGFRELSHAVASDVWIETLIICPALFKSEAQTTLVAGAEAAEVEIVELAEPAYRKISTREGPDGLIGVAIKREFLLEGAVLPENPLLVVVEKTEKPGNLGAILRTADAAGVDCVICCDPVTDIYNPNVIRSSQGLVFALPVFITSWSQCRKFLNSAGIQTVAATPHADTPIWEVDLAGPTAILLGSEKDGLSPEILNAINTRALIPMQGSADSLNVSASAAICLFEASRQRQNKS